MEKYKQTIRCIVDKHEGHVFVRESFTSHSLHISQSKFFWYVNSHIFLTSFSLCPCTSSETNNHGQWGIAIVFPLLFLVVIPWVIPQSGVLYVINWMLSSMSPMTFLMQTLKLRISFCYVILPLNTICTSKSLK